MTIDKHFMFCPLVLYIVYLALTVLQYKRYSLLSEYAVIS